MYLKKLNNIEENNIMHKSKFTLLLLIAFTYSFSQDVEVKKLDLNTKLDHFSVVVKNDKVYVSHNLKSKREEEL